MKDYSMPIWTLNTMSSYFVLQSMYHFLHFVINYGRLWHMVKMRQLHNVGGNTSARIDLKYQSGNLRDRRVLMDNGACVRESIVE